MSNSAIEKYPIDIVWLFKFVRHFAFVTPCGIFILIYFPNCSPKAQRFARISFVINGFAYPSIGVSLRSLTCETVSSLNLQAPHYVNYPG